MRREFDRPARKWPWAVVPLLGALLGGLAAFGVFGLSIITDSDALGPRGTPTDPFPSDAAFLGGIAIFVIPVAAILGAAVSAGVFGIAILVDDSNGLVWAIPVAGIVSAVAGGLMAFPLVAMTAAPNGTVAIVAVLSGLCGAILSGLALVARQP